MGSTSDRTAVTGAPGMASPRKGQVIGERYEVRHRLRDDPFSLGYLAFDQESEESVLLRIVRPELLDATVRSEVARALQRIVGLGGKYLPGLLDADRDRHWVYAAESLPEGVSFRDVLDPRIGQGSRLTAEELLPVIAHLEAALSAIPPSLRHGDVRAEHVWVDTHRLELKGPFFVPALPEGVVAAVLQRHGDLRRRVAPELMRGPGTSASDRYAIAAIAHEALTLQPPPEPGAAVSSELGALARPLGALLHPDPKRRPASVDLLVEGLARLSGLDAPDLEPAPFRKARRLRPRRSTHPPLAQGAGKTETMGGVTGKGDKTAPHQALSEQSAEDALTPSQHRPLSEVDEDAVKTAVRREPSTEAKTVVVGDPGERDEKTAVRREAPAGARGRAPLPPEPTRQDPSDKTAVSAAPTRPPDDDDFSSTTPELFDDELAEKIETSKMAAMSAKQAEVVLGRGATKELPVDDGSHHLSVVTTPDSDSLDPRLVRAALGVESSIDSDDDEVPSDPAIEAKPKKESSLDPRLVRMARAADKVRTKPKRFPSDPGLPAEEGDEESSLDPRLVRAALGLTMEESEPGVPLDPAVPVQPKKDGTQELAMDELDFVDGVPLDPSVPVQPKTDGTQELAMDDLDVVDASPEPAPVRETHGTDQISLDDLEQMAADHRRAAVPGGVKPVPRARKDSGTDFAPAAPLFDDSSAPKPEPVPSGIGVPVVAQAATPRPPRTEPPVDPIEPSETRSTKPRGVGMTVIVVALVVGLGIIIGSFMYARHKQAQADEARRQHLQQRFQQLQDQ